MSSFLVESDYPFVGETIAVNWGYVFLAHDSEEMNVTFRNGAGPMHIAIAARLSSVCIMLHQQ